MRSLNGGFAEFAKPRFEELKNTLNDHGCYPIDIVARIENDDASTILRIGVFFNAPLDKAQAKKIYYHGFKASLTWGPNVWERCEVLKSPITYQVSMAKLESEPCQVCGEKH